MTPGQREAVDDLLVLAIAGGATYAAAAEQAGCSESTVDRRTADPAFLARVEQARAERVARVADRMAVLSVKSLDVLSELLADASVADGIRARIALTVPTLAADAREAASLEARLAAVEARLAEQTDPQPRRTAWPA